MARQRKTKADGGTEFRLTPPEPKSPGRRSTRPGHGEVMQEHFAYNYGRLRIALEAVRRGKPKYEKLDYMSQARFRREFLAGTTEIPSFYEDERAKLDHNNSCSYCGRTTRLDLDHLIPRLKGGTDTADNLIYACRSCNSSKGPKDMVLWLTGKKRFPALLVLRRYLKLAAQWCETHDTMITPWIRADDQILPFDKRALRVTWPQPPELRLWPEPPNSTS